MAVSVTGGASACQHARGQHYGPGVRLFVSIRPPGSIVEALAAVPRPDATAVRWTSSTTWHITLRFLGQVADPEPVVEALGRTELGPRVTASLGPSARWLNAGVLVLPVGGLDDVARRVREATGDFGEAVGKPFVGHLTVARRRQRGSAPPDLDFPFTAHFAAAEVDLVASTLTPSGPIHDVVATFGLGR